MYSNRDLIVWYARVRHNYDDTLNKLNFGATGRHLDFFAALFLKLAVRGEKRTCVAFAT